MRTHGSLTKWNDDRGFGFITPFQNTGEIFVHISAFPRDGVRPQLNEMLSYETELGDNGKLRAIRVMRPAINRSSHTKRSRQSKSNKSSPISKIIVVLVIAAVGVIVYSQFNKYQAQQWGIQASKTLKGISFSSSASRSPSPFHCDGRQHCSQMTSCAEAKYFIQHCPDTKMDGDNDGVPCEQDICSSFW